MAEVIRKSPDTDAERVNIPELAAWLANPTATAKQSRLPEAALLYLDMLEAGGRSPHTIAAYRRALMRFHDSLNGNPADGLAVRDFLDSYANHNSRLHGLITLRQWYGFQIARGLCTDDPTAGIPISKFRRRDYPPIAAEEFARFLTFLAPQMQVFATVLYYVGSRVTETCQIRVEHLYFDGDYGTIDFPCRKGGEAGFAAFGPEVSAVLRPWVVGKSGWVFPKKRTPGPTSKQDVAPKLMRAGISAGIVGRVTPHRFKHNFATDAAEAGWNMLALQKQLGHNDPRSTAWYYRPSRKGLIKAYRRARENPQS